MPDTQPLAAKERPILFSAAMVDAILHRGKSQTRRLLKPQPEWRADFRLTETLSGAFVWPGKTRTFASYHLSRLIREVNRFPELCPLGKTGDRIWVRETWYQNAVTGEYLYRADRDDPSEPPVIAPIADVRRASWRPSIFMPREACRLVLEIASVRVAGLQDISDEDCFAEGVHPMPLAGGWTWDGETSFPRPCEAYWDLWDRINPKHPVASDPLCWALTFRRREVARG